MNKRFHKYRGLHFFRFTIILILIFFGSFSNLAAQVRINGIIIDKSSKFPIEDAYVAWERGQMVLTDGKGRFSINVSKFPAKLTISHLSYGLSEITLDEEPEDPFYIRLDKELSEIGEVQVSGERLRILTQHDDYSIIDFAFDKHFMWMLGYVNNQANRQKLFLANPYGDTICTIPVRRGEKLFRDAFENVHLLTRDSAYQLFSPGDSIELLYASGRKIFDDTMEGILCGFNNKLVYKDFVPKGFDVTLYYLCIEDPYRHHLTSVFDTIGLEAARQGSIIDENARRGGQGMLLDMWKYLGRYTKEGTKIAAMANPPVPIELFTYNDTLFVLNFLKDSLLCYSPDGKFARAVEVDFHYEERLLGIDYRELEFIADQITSKVYIAERRIAGWILHPFNTSTGKLMPEVLLPDFAGMTSIRAYNDAIYFLYHEKLFPYFTRLYRYQL